MENNNEVVWFDVETTGVNTSTDRIIQIFLLKTDYEGNELGSYKTYINPQGVKSRPEAMEKHGIRDEDLLEYDHFGVFADEILEFIGDSDLGGYNIMKFDIPILMEEFMRFGKVFNYRNRAIVDPLNILYALEPRDLGSVYKRFVGKELNNAHDAEADVLGTVEIFKKQKKYFSLPETAKDLDLLINPNRNEYLDLAQRFKVVEDKGVVIAFGKYNDRLVKDVYQLDPGYFDWIINKGQFSTETKIIARKIIDKLKQG